MCAQQVQTTTTATTRQQPSKAQYDIKFVPHPQLGAPYMMPVVVLDTGK
jgi:hypothetical protein